MSVVINLKKWSCDYCPTENPTVVYRTEYGLPKGWIVEPATLQVPITKHRCNACKKPSK